MNEFRQLKRTFEELLKDMSIGIPEKRNGENRVAGGTIKEAIEK